MKLMTVVSTIAGVSYLVAASVAVRKRSLQDRLARFFALYALTACLWELSHILSSLGWFAFPYVEAEIQMAFHGLFVLSVLFLLVSRAFLGHSVGDWKIWLMGTTWLIVLIILDSNPGLLSLVPTWPIERRQLIFGAPVLGWGTFTGITTVLTFKAYRRTNQPLHKNRLTFWSLALIFIVIGAAFCLTGRPVLCSSAYLLSALWVTYVTLTHRLLDVRHIVRQVICYLITTSLTIALYTGSFLAAQYILQTTPTYNPVMVGALWASIIAVLFNPLLRLVRRLIDRAIAGASRDHSHTLSKYSTRISNVLDLEELATIVVDFIRTELKVQYGALFVVHHRADETEADGHFRLRWLRENKEQERLPTGVISAASPVTDCLHREHIPLTQYDVDLHQRFREIATTERAWLESLNMDLYVPIHVKGEWVGLLALGPKCSGDRYFEDDMVLLATLADQTAVALDNARLFDDLKVRSAEIERLNDDLAIVNRELSKLGRAKANFLDVASHELRTPLTQVRGYTDILKEMVETKSLDLDAAENMLRGLKEAAYRLQEIVDMMFDVAKIDTETLRLNLLQGSVAPIIEDVASDWAPALRERNQTLTIEGLEDLPPILADGKRLKQAFSQLIQNAIKFTPNGGQIRVSGQLREWTLPRDQSIEIIVADTGIGIAPDELEHIFEKFYRPEDALLHSTGKTKFKGAGPGLGLAIVRGIVEAHGGHIWAESPGYDEKTCPGGEFHVVLPLQPQLVTPEEILPIRHCPGNGTSAT